MSAEPADVAGDCNAHLHIGDDYADNHATMRCERPKGHAGLHREQYESQDQIVVVEWKNDERNEWCAPAAGRREDGG